MLWKQVSGHTCLKEALRQEQERTDLETASVSICCVEKNGVKYSCVTKRKCNKQNILIFS